MADLSTTKTALSATGASQSFTAPANGMLVVKLWGAGGAGGMGFAANGAGANRGGAGGFTHVAVRVTAGQVVRFDVGKGGQGPQYVSGASGSVVGAGGAGGWPDGGAGGYNTLLVTGGGGGSSRLYIDGVLQAVAGAGGGQGQGDARFLAGAAGGLTGQTNTNTYSNSLYSTGGTQVAGGVNAYRNDSTSNGASLQGGQGYGAGGSPSTMFPNCGGGGGGGYYGGAGGGIFATGNQIPTSGAGGSSYVKSGLTGRTIPGDRDIVGGTADADYADSAGLGGLSRSTPGTPIATDNGTDGRIVYTFTADKALPSKFSLDSNTDAATYVCTTDKGILSISMWGGGGAACTRASGPTPSTPGGGAGYTRLILPVVAGDVVQFDIGKGGTPSPITTSPAPGAWPDGGAGGKINTANYGHGSGGGSTRVWLNGVLVAVAGAGGGSGITPGGAGGGPVGYTGITFGGSIGSTGGSQTAGGISPQRPTETAPAGKFLQGGDGWADSTASVFGEVNTSGGGGGGGYYGGGGGSMLTTGGYMPPGGGGSSYINQALAVGSTQAGIGQQSGGLNDPNYNGNVGRGGYATTAFAAAAAAGGGGSVVVEFAPTGSTLPSGSRVMVDPIGLGSIQHFKAAAAGNLAFSLWGAGGGGATRPGAFAREGGAGGYTTATTLAVAAGDIISVEVGRGGKCPTGLNVNMVGGWPDGGHGGLTATSGTGLGSGGGSTRVYKNGVLMAVAAGGGGAGLWPGGGGGGTTGTQDTTTQAGSPGAPNNGTGGTQTAGGVAASRTTELSSRGSMLQGGMGWADNVTGGNADWSGAGGGGGYFGGGGGSYISSGGGTPSGGGGSSFTHASVTGVTTAGTASGGGVLPQGTADANYVKGRGVGGVGSTGFSVAGGNGTDGAASLLFTASGSAVTQNLVQNTPTMLVGVPGRQTFTAPADGLLVAKLWGGGGGGGLCSTSVGNDPGGGGGFTYVQIPITSGQVIDFDVADGGQGGQWAGTAAPYTTSTSGLGGWPDGGNGGGNTTSLSGGGGGSTRLYIGGVLKAVAGGGGGTGQGDTRWQPGAGGGLVGQDGSNTVTPAMISTGGTQAAGGTNSVRPADTVSSGGSLRGGHGYPTGGSTASAPSVMVGGGGGGGYYGGAGGGNNTTASVHATSGGGGSSYVAAGVAGYTNAGSRGASGGVTDVDCPYGIGNGGASKTTTGYPDDGGAGAAHYVFVTAYNTLPENTKTTLASTNQPVFYKATKAGTLTVKMWGGGGGGGAYSGTGPGEPGGGAGYTKFDIPVAIGQVLRFDPGSGGKGAKWISGVPNGVMAGSGGLGGWPDGGAGGFNNRAISGGGGGSSRLWIDNVLVSVAAGGGGDGLGETNRRPGAGGGLTGQASINTLSSSGYGTGGTQTAGGVNNTFPTDRAMAGAFLAAGRGYGTTFPPAVHSETSGGGGGGGYYGGGAGGGGPNSASATVAAGGAGGSSFVSSAIPNISNVAYQTKSGNQQISVGGQDDPDYIYKVGLGGAQYLSTTNVGAGADGNDGSIVFTFLTTQTLVENTPTALPATGISRKFVSTKTGTLKIKMWGGAGSAGTYSVLTSGTVSGLTGGGNGAFTYAEIEVVAGQVVQIDVGKGGGPTQYIGGAEGSYVGVAGAGGWPDGGPGYHNLYVIPGGGGGSTRVFVDGVLKAVAGAGGGAAGDSRLFPGGGGARVGQATTNTVASGVPAQGGTQIAGGTNNFAPTDATNSGSYLRGGSGGQGAGVVNRWTANAGTGYGGGGGYFGGSGGGQSSNYVTSGAGGSGYLAKDVGGYMESANYGVAAGNGADSDLPAGCAVGSKLRVNANGAAGGDGHAVYTFVPSAPTPNVKTVVTDTGVREYIVAADGPASFKLWGGGGGGSNCPTGGTDQAAAGGFTTLSVNLVAGQRLRFEVGQGGEGGNWVSGPSSLLVGVAGRGGFPDGGSAGFNNQAIAGGGGGSSRVWLDGKLLAVAGGGGAQGVGLANRTGGTGGGVAGGTNLNTPRPASTSAGGTQTIGGASVDYPTDPINLGSYLRGGDGFVTGLDAYTHSSVVGGGAGGGYYGGAGGICAAIQSVPGGAGGSGFLGPTGQMTITDPDQGLLIYYNSFDQSITNDDLYGSPTTTIGTGVSRISPSTKFASGGMLSSGGAGLIKATLPRGLNLDDFTIDGWFKHDALPTGALAQVYFALGDLSANGMAIYYAGDGNIVMRLFSESNPAIYDRKVVIANDLNWHHLAVSRDADGTRLYRDGVLLLTHPTIYNLTATGLLLGSYTTAGASIFNGKTDEFRIFSGKGRYTANFTPPAAPMGTYSTVSAPLVLTDTDKALLLYYNSFDRTFLNDDLNGAPTVPQGYGVSLTYPSSKFSTGGMVTLPGTGHLKATLSQGLGLSDFTIEGWFKHDVLPTGGQVQVYFTTGEAAANGLAVYCQASTISLSQFGGTYLQNIPFTNDLNWHHLALVRDATSTRLYRDGVLIASHTNVLNLSATVFNLGNYQAVDASIYKGQIDEVRVFKGKARYTANFTPPATPLSSAATTSGVGAVPGGSTDPDYASGVGIGAPSRTTIGKAQNGGNGRIVFQTVSTGGDADASGILPTITVSAPTGQAVQTTNLPIPGQFYADGYTGATKSYQASVATLLHVEMWGAGGGGVSAANLGGGGGGYTIYDIQLQAGDVVTVQSPSGGGGGTGAGSPPGVGGYPDGGTGFSPATLTHKGGGGGSSRLYINGVLAAVAGGGGGGNYGGFADDAQGGPGGGTSGVAGGTPGGGPGTAVAGGAGVGNGIAGAFLQGGAGGVTNGVGGGNGPGGGGGYYGGGGGGQSGGGGSGYVNTGVTGFIFGSTTAGTGNQPAGKTSAFYAAGTGAGTGVGSTGGNLPGGAGRIVLYNNTPTPGNASGIAGGTVVVTPPVGGVDAPPLGAISIGTVLVVPPGATAGVPAFASGNLGPEITMGAPIAVPAAQAISIVPINDNTSILITPPAVDPFFLDANIDADLVTVHVVAPTGYGSVAQNPVAPATGDIGTVVVEPPVGMGSIGSETIVPIDVTVTVTPPQAGATGQGANSVLFTKDYVPEFIRIGPVYGNVSVYGGPDGNASVAPFLPTITVTTPLADFVPLDFIIDGPLPAALTVTPPEADGAGNALIVPEPYMDNGNPSNWYYGRVTMSPPAPFLETSADFTTYLGIPPIIIGTPQAAADLSISILVPLPAPIIINGADADATVDIPVEFGSDIDITPPDATAAGGIGANVPGVMPPDIVVTPPEGEVTVPVTATGDLGPDIVITPPEGQGQIPAATSGNIGVITVVKPEGTAEGFISADATGLLPTITVTAPLGGNVASAAVSLPLGTVFVTMGNATPSAGTNLSRALPIVTISPPAGIGQVAGVAEGALSVITIVSPEGVAYEAIPADASGGIGTIVLTPPDATFEGHVNFAGALPTIDIRVPDGRGEVPADIIQDLPVITVEPVLGTGTTDVVRADGELPTVLVEAPEADASGQGLGVVSLPTVVVSPVSAELTAEVDLSTPIDLTIYLTPPQGIGYPVIPASAEGDIGTILVTASDGTATGAVLIAQQAGGTVQVQPPVASPSGEVNLITDKEFAIIVSPPVGEFYREASVITGLPTIYVYPTNASVEADGKTASASGELATIYVDTPDGFAEVPVIDGIARIQFRRSLTRGNVPTSLKPHEIAFHEIDGTLFTRDAAGDVKATPLNTLRRLPASQGTEGQVLRADGTWGAPVFAYPLSVPVEPHAGGTIVLADAVVGSVVSTPTIGATITHAFFVPRTLAITTLSFDVAVASVNTVEVGVAPLSLAGVVGSPLVAVSQIVSGAGVQSVAGTAVTLEPGWYVSTFKVTGAGSTTFRAATAPTTVAADFTTVQGSPAYVSAQV